MKLELGGESVLLLTHVIRLIFGTETHIVQRKKKSIFEFLKPNKQLTLLPICGVWIWQIVKRIELRKIFRMTWATLNNSRRPGLNKVENCTPYRQHSRTSISVVYLCNLFFVWKIYSFKITVMSFSKELLS